ncbi:MAG: hypothetical protein LBI41_03670 [Lactobacillales bacterium]|jgi:hypothetical protein|nr:hypothetical protein [Lactobacillales bacterium]
MKFLKKVILLFVVFTFFNTLKASAIPVVRQVNDQPVTKRNQLVTFAGTNGYAGINTPAEHQNDPTDTWLVMQVERNHALIIKQNPIAVQEYKHNGHAIARYNQSDIKASVEAWWSMVNGVRLDAFPIQDYTLPVKLNGENQSDVSNSAIFRHSSSSSSRTPGIVLIQGQYKTTIDPSENVYAFIPSYIDVSTAISAHVDVGESVWTSFVAAPPPPEKKSPSEPPLSLAERRILDILHEVEEIRTQEAVSAETGVIRCTDLYCTHLRSPLNAPWYDEEGKHGIAAYITPSGSITSGGTGVPMYAHFGVRPACWVNIQASAPASCRPF